MARKNTKKEVDVTSLLAGLAGAPKPKGKKKGVPELTDAAALADKVARAYIEKADADAAFKLVEAEVLEHTGPEYEKRAKHGGDFTKSFDVLGAETDGVQVVYQDKFTELPATAEAGLREQLKKSELDYDSYFETKREITVGKTDDATVALLVKKLGPELFAEIFQVKLSIVTKANMDRRQFELPEGLATLAGLKQYKASVKLIKPKNGGGKK